jgi:hypothetical protein
MAVLNTILEQQEGMKTEGFRDATPCSLTGTDVSAKPDISIYKTRDGGSRFPKNVDTKTHGVIFRTTVT